MNQVVHFPCWTQVNISWDHIIDKINDDVKNGHWAYSSKPTSNDPFPTIIGEGNTLPSCFVPVSKKVYDDFGFDLLDTYVSFTSQSRTLGRHCDNIDVFIVGAIGITKYRFDYCKEYTIKSGCGIYIPAGVYHEPINCTPRAVLSFSNG